MAFNASWWIVGRVILIEIDEEMTAEAIRDGVHTVNDLMNNTDAPLYLVSDTRRLRRFPTNMVQISKMIDRQHLKRIVQVALVTHNPIIRLSATVLSPIGISVRVFDEIEPARAFLQQLDSSLVFPPLIPAPDGRAL